MFRATFIILLSLILSILMACSDKESTRSENGSTETGQNETEKRTETVAVSEPSGNGGGEDLQEVSYTRDVAPIFAAKCVYCHHPTNAVKVDLTRPFDEELGIIRRPNSWSASENKTLVVPGDPEASALVLKITRTDLDPHIEGYPMPWNIEPLATDEIDQLRIWILEGAKDDNRYRSTIVRIFGDGVSLGSRAGKCAYCHHPGSQFGPDLTNPFDPVRGVVNVEADVGGIRVVPGDPEASILYQKIGGSPLSRDRGRAMPLQIERLTDAEIRTIVEWVAEGARNN